MNQYVLCYAHPKAFQWYPEVLLIEKKKPAWQCGRYNLPGGHVEEGETVHEAACRELFEETDISCALEDVTLMGTIEGPDFIVYVMHCEFDSLRGNNAASSVTSETVFWLPFEQAFREPLLIDNLRIIIPLVRSKLIGWSLTEAIDSICIQLKEDNANT